MGPQSFPDVVARDPIASKAAGDESGLRELNGRVNGCGLHDLDRRPRPVAAAYRSLLEEFGRIAIVPGGELFVTTDQPATLKASV